MYIGHVDDLEDEVILYIARVYGNVGELEGNVTMVLLLAV